MLTSDQIEGLKKRERTAHDIKHQGWMSEWKDIATYMSPERVKYLYSTRYTPGNRRLDRSKIYNDAYFRAIDVSLAGIKGGSIPHSLPWFRVGIADDDLEKWQPVRDWLHNAQTWMYGALSRSNFYDAMTTPYLESLLFATGAFQVIDDRDSLFRIDPWTIGQYSLLLGENGDPDVGFRNRFFSLRALVEKYGEDKLSLQSRTAYQRDKDAEVEVVQAIFPRKDYDSNKVDTTNMPWASIWWEKNGDKPAILEESGYRVQSAMYPRWDTMPSEPWGTSCPGMKTIQNVKMLQTLEKDILLISAQKGRPAMNVPSKLKGRLSLHPDAQNVVSGKELETVTRTLNFDPDIAPLENKAIQTLDRIERGFYNDLFLLLASDDTTQKTAYEIARRHDEKLAILSPTIERLNRSSLSPTLGWLFAKGLQKGLIPDPPEELEGLELKIEYVSILAQAQKAAGIKTSEQLVDFVGRLGAAQAGAGLEPTAMDKLDIDAMVDDYADSIGSNPKTVLDTQEAERVRADRDAARAAQAQMASAGAMASAVKDLGQANMGGDETALSTLTAGLPAP